MRKKVLSVLAGIMLPLVFCTGCNAPDPSTGAAESLPAESLSAEPAPETELVPVLDEESLDLLQDFHIAGAFHHGAAFVARYTSWDTAIIEGELECGYLTTEGEYIPLYTVPEKICLMNPARSYYSYHTDPYIEVETAIYLNRKMTAGPFISQQETMDDVLAMGDNGWVPYFENGKWGYCDLEKNIRIQPAYDQCLPFRDGKALVCNYDGREHWMFIDEKGAVLSSFSQSGVFPYRLPGDLVLLTGDGGSFLCGTDGSLIKEYPGAVSALTGEDCFILAGTMYDSQGKPLYEAGDLADVAPFKGRAVYAENDVYGIRGTDGEVLCPARFAQIFQLTEEGFYAMEQGSRQVGLYDDAGGPLEEAPPSVRISPASEGEICLLDSHGNILDNHQWNIIGTSLDFSCEEQTFFAREGYGYINLGWYEMLTLHILFEEREVEEPAAAAPSLGFTTLATMKGVDATGLRHQEFDHVMTESFSDQPDYYGEAGVSNLLWYQNTSNEIIFCDQQFNTIFTVPRDAVDFATHPAADGSPIYPSPRFLTYLGEGLWNFQFDEVDIYTDKVYKYQCVFSTDGEALYQRRWTVPKYDSRTWIGPCVEGLFFGIEEDRFYTKTGEEIFIDRTDGVRLKNTSNAARCFREGLAATQFGYVDRQGTLVIPAGTILEQLSASMGEPADPDTVALHSFVEGQATVELLGETNRFFVIDTQGAVVQELADYPPFYKSFDVRFINTVQETVRKTSFLVAERNNQPSLLRISGGKEVMAPDGMEFLGKVLQYQDDWAFVMVETQDGTNGFVPVDSEGRFYPDVFYNEVSLLQNGSYCGESYYTNEKMENVADLTLFTVAEG